MSTEKVYILFKITPFDSKKVVKVYLHENLALVSLSSFKLASYNTSTRYWLETHTITTDLI